MHFLTSYNQSICVKGERCWNPVFLSLISPQLWSEKGLELALSYPSLYKLKTSIDRLRASARISGRGLLASLGTCVWQTTQKAPRQWLLHTHRGSAALVHPHIPILNSEQLSPQRRYGMKGLTESTKEIRVPSPRGLGNRGVVIFLLRFKIVTSLEKGPVRGPGPADSAGNQRPCKAR